MPGPLVPKLRGVVLAAQVAPTLTGLAALPNLRTISLHGCTAATQAADAALNKLLKALKVQRPPRVKVGALLSGG